MTILVKVKGRESIPVRAIPFITGWGMSPLDVANHLARIDGAPFGFLDDMFAYHLQSGSAVKVLPKEWDSVRAELMALEAEIKAKHQDEDAGYAAWRKESVLRLPAAVFVFKDEFEQGWARKFQIKEFQEQREGEHALNYTPMFLDGMRDMAMKGFESATSQDWREALKEKRVISKAPPPIKPTRGVGVGSVSRGVWAKEQTKPDWANWRLRTFATIWEAAALATDIDPRSMKPLQQTWMGGTSKQFFLKSSFMNAEQERKFENNYSLIVDWAKTHGDKVRHHNTGEIELKEFAAWAGDNELQVPEEFAALSNVSKPAIPTGKPPTPSPQQHFGSSEQYGQDWKEAARRIADELFDYDTSLNTRDTLVNYSKRVMEKMQSNEIHGPRGRIDNPKTIMREALQGDMWWSNKKK